MQDIARHPNDFSEKAMAYAIPMCVGCTEVISLRIRDCASLKMAWLPATVTHLQFESAIEFSVNSALLTRTFPKLQVFIIDTCTVT